MVAAVKANAALAAVVAARVYPDLAEQGAALPHLVWSVSGGGPKQASDGSGPDHQVDVSWTIRATTRLQAQQVADLLSAVLDGWTNSSTPAVSSCTLENESTGYEFRSDDSDELVRTVEQDYTVWYA